VFKLCSNCREEVYRIGRNSSCKKCQKYSNTLMRAIESEKFYVFLAEDKCLTGCEECGYGKGEKDKACALHYDHLNKQEKNFEISIIGSSSNTFKNMVKKYELERTKCRVLCANCHSLHSKEQQQEDKEQNLTEAIQHYANIQHRELTPKIKFYLYQLINIGQEPPSQMELRL